MNAIKNYGIDLGKERSEQSPDDWQFGAITSVPCLFNIPQERRKEYLPKGEVQGSDKDDMSDCATRAPNNKLAAKFTYAYKNNLIKNAGNRAFLEKHYLRDGVIDFSDAFNAILSGTTRQGNSMKAPLESIRKDGLIPKHMLPLEKWMTFEQYHDIKRITQEMRDIGQEFARRFTINYEQAYEIHFGELLKEDMVCVAAYAWPDPVNGVYPKADYPINHEFLLWSLPKFLAFDNYIDKVDNDFIKNLAPDYDFFEYGYRVYVSKENDIDSQVTTLQSIIETLKKILEALSKKVEYVPAPVPTPKPVPKEVQLNALALAIQKFEDYVIPGGRYRNGKIAPDGSLSFRCKNPGNCRYSSVGYLAKYGKVTEYKTGNEKPGQRGFAIFPTYELGFLYLKNLLLEKAKKHPTWNLYQLIGDRKEGWAPAVDNNQPDIYARFLAKEMAVDINTWKMANILG